MGESCGEVVGLVVEWHVEDGWALCDNIALRS